MSDWRDQAWKLRAVWGVWPGVGRSIDVPTFGVARTARPNGEL